MGRFFDALRTFHERHERLKRTVHTAWRYPLPRWGQYAMGCFYFCIPVVGGYYVMQWAIGKSHESIGEHGEKLRIKEVEGLGDKTTIGGETKRVGAGGMLGGVKLAVSDKDDQARNKAMLEAFFRKERKKRKRKGDEVFDEQKENRQNDEFDAETRSEVQ